MSIAKYSYPFTSAYEYEARERARSLDRCERSCRSVSPFGIYGTVRSSSVIPKALQYRDDREYSPETKPSPTRREYYRATSCLPHKSNYETTDLPYQRTYYNYYYRTLPKPLYYTPKKYTRPITDTYTRSRALPPSTMESSLVRTLTPRDTTYSSARPYESYSYVSPYLSRTYSTYTPSDSYNCNVQNSPRNYSYRTQKPLY